MSQDNVFIRREKKYLVKTGTEQQLLGLVGSYLQPDDYASTQIDSLYLDTPDHLLVRRSIEKPLYKEKLRIRAYDLVTGGQPVFIEEKRKFAGAVYKRRIAMELNDARRFVTQGIGPKLRGADQQARVVESQIASELLWSIQRYQPLQPFMQISYHRHSYTEKTRTSARLRITFDYCLRWREGDWNLNGDSGQELLPADHCLMEVKINGGYPLWLCRALDELRLYPASFSKVGAAYRRSLQRGGCHDLQSAT